MNWMTQPSSAALAVIPSRPVQAITAWLFLSCLLFCLAAGKAFADKERVLDFAKVLGDQVVKVLGDDALSKQTRNDRLVTILNSAIDLDVVGKAVLAQHWRAASKTQRAQYLNLFKQLAAVQLSSVLSSYSFSGETYEIEKIITLRDNKLWSVYTRILRPGQSDVLVQWVILKKKSNALVLFDVKAEQFSLINTKRDEFSAVVSRKGIDGLIEELQAQTEAPS